MIGLEIVREAIMSPVRKKSRTVTKGPWQDALGGFPRGLNKAAAVAINDVMRVKKGERVLIITNPQADVTYISAALADAIAARGADATIITQPTRTSLNMASDSVIHALRSEPEVIISISAAKLGKDRFGLVKPYSFKGHKGSWNHIFNALQGSGKSRSFWSPAVTIDSFVRTVAVDYKLMRQRAAKLKRALDKADRLHISAPGGTDIELGLRGRLAFTDDGSFWRPGTGGNLPAGETYISPANYDAEGVLVFDGSLAVVEGGAFVPRKPVTVEVSGGRAVNVTGGAGAKRFEDSLIAGEKVAAMMKGQKGWPAKRIKSYVTNARHLGEVGIGLNPAARVTGNMLEDEKILGTCHIAIGSNYDNDAEAFIHLDCIVQAPTISVITKTGRRREIMRGGKIL
jgi:aminopeptidase